ncbi:RHS repeat-associated core domain-containing protein [Pseudomonas sp. NPDC008258]|uniref:RHS repeat-associated core domain-containing protein n=1 Tax=Pseudomonas sp. NPDC008258 TaxID=3364418 RepID=UPI0036E442EC
MLLFYHLTSPTALIHPTKAIRILGHGRQALALQQCVSTPSSLVAIDSTQSPLRVMNPGNTQVITYTAFGFGQGLAELPLGFNGEHWDTVSMLYALGAGYRWFSSLMRFTSPDSASPFGKGGINTYAYALNDPVNNFDPDGHFSIARFLGLKQNQYRKLEKIYGWGEYGDGIYKTTQNVLRKPKIVVLAHGQGQTISIDGMNQSPEQLTNWMLSKNINPKDYRKATLLSCNLGTTDFPQTFSNINNIVVRAAEGTINTSAWIPQEDGYLTKISMQIRRSPDDIASDVYRLTTYRPR